MKLADVCTLPVNLAGLPAISVPCGLVRNLPIGLQLIGRAYDEATLFQVAAAYERATEWHASRPSLAAVASNT
jgi:aspartyl-tRNA(Asn)/glutamyl-tRNA(Gln) amidotransferase subunit A